MSLRPDRVSHVHRAFAAQLRGAAGRTARIASRHSAPGVYGGL